MRRIYWNEMVKVLVVSSIISILLYLCLLWGMSNNAPQHVQVKVSTAMVCEKVAGEMQCSTR